MSPKPSSPTLKEEPEILEDASMFLRDESPFENKDAPESSTQSKPKDQVPVQSEEAAVAAAVAAIQKSNSPPPKSPITKLPNPPPPPKDAEEEGQPRPWPIDKMVNPEEFSKLPPAVRESLVASADLANGHTYIDQIEPKSFETEASVVDYLIKFADHEGFTISKTKEGDKTTFTCDHDKVYTQTLKRPHPDEEAATDPNSPYERCPFQVAVVLDEKLGLWTLQVVCAEHNHGPTGPAASAKRRRFTYFQKTLQEDFVLPKLIKHNTAPGTPKEPGESQEPRKEVDLLKGLVGALRFDNALLEDQVDEYGQVTHLFWTTPDCIEMLQQFPEVLFINFTKSPNVPTLVHIVGMTAFNTTFEVGYAFIKEVGLADFRWVLFSLKDVLGKYFTREYSPSAVITHREPMLISAIDNVFANTSQICVTQLMREVNDKCSSSFSDAEERRTFIKLFQELVDSETPDIYAYNESDFRKKYSKTKILEFVSYHWLIYKTKFVRAWVDQHLHFNNYSMGKAEIAQATLKGYAEESGGDLLKIYYRINNLLKRKKIAHEELVERELERCPVKFFVPFYDDVRFKISTHALEMIKEQHELYLEAMSVHEPLHRCTRMFTTTTGLPCKHTLSRPVTMEDCSSHWWLSKQRPLRDMLSESERLANELTTKFERTVGLVKQHFLNYSSLESREFMLMNMIKYFSRAGIANIDSRSGLSHNQHSSTSLSSMGSRATPPAMSGAASPMARTPTPRSPALAHVPASAADTSSDGSPVSMPLTMGNIGARDALSAGEESDGQFSSFSGAEDGRSMKMGGFNSSTPRRCGRCNQVGHNSRTCGQRLPLNGG